MAKYVYPVIFTKENELYSVTFPDFESCYTQGESLLDALEMASDVLCLTLYNLEESNAKIPSASDPYEIKITGNELVSLVSCDIIRSSESLQTCQYYNTIFDVRKTSHLLFGDTKFYNNIK